MAEPPGGIARGARGDGRPLIKVCGLTRAADLAAALAAGVDLVGLNFHPPSPRYLQPRRAAGLAARARGRAGIVGVFVDRSREEIEAIDAEVGLDLIQFHGDETPADLAPFGARAVKVLRLGPGERPGPRVLSAVFASYPAAWGFLVDVRHPKLHGGTGESWSWDAVAGSDAGGRPLLVAGGLRPDNAAAALAASGAHGCDVCSGVESSPGVKDSALLAALVRAVGRDGRSPSGPRYDSDDSPPPPNSRNPPRGQAALPDPQEDPDGEDRAP